MGARTGDQGLTNADGLAQSLGYANQAAMEAAAALGYGANTADGTLAGHNLDERWQFNFLHCSGALGSHVCAFTDNNDNFDLTINLAYMGLPNGKHSIMLRNSQNWNGTGTDFGWSPMTPQ